MWKEFLSSQPSQCSHRWWHRGRKWSLAVAGQPADARIPCLRRLHHWPVLDPVCCTLRLWVSTCASFICCLHKKKFKKLPFCYFCLTPHRSSNPKLWKVRSGDVSLLKMSSSAGNTVQKVISHESFNTNTYENDIALLKLNTPLKFTGKDAQNFYIHLLNIEVCLKLTWLYLIV